VLHVSPRNNKQNTHALASVTSRTDVRWWTPGFRHAVIPHVCARWGL